MNQVAIVTQEHRIVKAMQLLGDPTRFKMFKLITQQQNMCVSEIAQQLSISASAVSQHFRQFELLQLVEKRRMGQKICYEPSSNDQLVDELVKLTNVTN